MSRFRIVEPHAPFDYGSAVRVKPKMLHAHSIKSGSVFGFQTIGDPSLAATLDVPVGTVFVLVEDNTGADAKIPADHLELIN